MANTDDRITETPAAPVSPDKSALTANPPADTHTPSPAAAPPAAPAAALPHGGKSRGVGRKGLLLVGAAVGLALGGYFLVPWAITALTTVSTDDAYVNSHVTFVAPRVAGQVSKVLVEETDRVRAGDLLVELDKQPYKVQYDLKSAAVQQARADQKAAEAQARGFEATARSR